MKAYVAFMKQWAPNDSPRDFIGLSGHVNAAIIAHALQRCGDDLRRENLRNLAADFNKDRVDMLLPGIELTNSKEDYAPYRSLRMAVFEKELVETSRSVTAACGGRDLLRPVSKAISSRSPHGAIRRSALSKSPFPARFRRCADRALAADAPRCVPRRQRSRDTPQSSAGRLRHGRTA